MSEDYSMELDWLGIEVWQPAWENAGESGLQVAAPCVAASNSEPEHAGVAQLQALELCAQHASLAPLGVCVQLSPGQVSLISAEQVLLEKMLAAIGYSLTSAQLMPSRWLQLGGSSRPAAVIGDSTLEVLRTHALHELLAQPSLKRSAWQVLQCIVKA